MSALQIDRPRTRVIVAAMLVFPAAFAMAQSSGPYAAYIFPAGGQRGTTFTATVGGQNLSNPLGVEVSGAGVTVRVVDYTGPRGPLTAAQQEELRRRLQELAGTKPGGPATPGASAGAAAGASEAPRTKVELPDLEELRDLETRTKRELRLVADQFLNRDKRPKPPMNEVVRLEITIRAGAASGDRSLRLRTRAGLANPLVFQVGTSAETSEPGRFTIPPAEPPLLALPSVLNGQIFPGEVDRFGLKLDEGQAVDLSVEARSLIPYLADAVPGFIQPVLAVSGPDGREVAYCDDDGLDPDPRVSFRAPTSGVYTVAVRDSIYRGREDFVYRLCIGSPAAGAQAAPAEPRGSTAAGPAVATIAVPAKVRGVVAKPGSIVAYEFDGHEGETVVAEVRARRDGSPLDSFLRLRDPSGKVIAANDDTEDKEYGLLLAHTDSYLRVTLPSAGTWRLELMDTTGKGGKEYAYTLDVRKPAADFIVLTTLSALNLGPTGSAAFSVVAVRKDGWEGDITIRLRRPDRAYSLEGAVIPAGRERVQMTITRRGRAAEETAPIELEAAARVDGIEVVRPVIPADLRMQAFGNTHLVAAEALWASTRRTAAVPFAFSPVWPLVLAPGGSLELTVGYPPKLPAKSLRVELVNPPAGIMLKEQRASEDRLVLVFAADSGVKPGTENLVLSLKGVPAEAKAPVRELDLGVLPALVVNIAAQSS